MLYFEVAIFISIEINTKGELLSLISFEWAVEQKVNIQFILIIFAFFYSF